MPLTLFLSLTEHQHKNNYDTNMSDREQQILRDVHYKTQIVEYYLENAVANIHALDNIINLLKTTESELEEELFKSIANPADDENSLDPEFTHMLLTRYNELIQIAVQGFNKAKENKHKNSIKAPKNNAQ